MNIALVQAWYVPELAHRYFEGKEKAHFERDMVRIADFTQRHVSVYTESVLLQLPRTLGDYGDNT